MLRERLTDLDDDALVTRAMRRVLRGRAMPPPDWDARPRRVLFLRHDRIGDMIMATGVIRAIAESHPTITVDVLASPGNAAVLTGLRFVREVLQLDGVKEGARPGVALPWAWDLWSRRYDAAVDGLVLSPAVSPLTATLLSVCGTSCRIGMRAVMGQRRPGTQVYTTPVEPPENPGANHIEYLQRLAVPFGVAPEDVPHPTLQLAVAEREAAEQVWADAARDQHGLAPATSDTREGGRLLVNVSAGHPLRRWGDAQFVAVLRHVRAAHPGATVVVVGEPAERAAFENVAREAGATAASTAGIRAALALVAAADGVLTPDTSIAHAASAFHKPCVTLMLPGAEPFTPYRTAGEVVMSSVMEMTAVPVAAVVRALDRLFVLMARCGVTAGVAG